MLGCWRADALCMIEEHPLDLFFPSGMTGAALEQTERAKAVCARCDVMAQCLDYALNTNQDGIWGNTTEEERRTLRRRPRRLR